MVPVVLPERKPDQRELMQSTPMEYPLWIRGDDSDDEAVHDEAKRRLDSFRGRTARKRRDGPAAAGRDGGNDTSSLPQDYVQLGKRSQRKDAAGALVDRSAGAVKRGEAKSEDKEHSSGESGDEASRKKPGEAPKRLMGYPPSKTGNQSAPSSAPLPQSPPKVSKESEAPAVTNPPAASPTGDNRPCPVSFALVLLGVMRDVRP